MIQESSSRRGFLKVLAQSSAIAGAACLGVACSSAGVTAPVDAGNISDLPVGTLRVVTGESVAIGRDSGGVYAMTLICTHQGCDISTDGSVSIQAVVCNCHQSTFSPNGVPLSGPAQSALEHYAVTVSSAGAITIDTTVVDAAVRTKV